MYARLDDVSPMCGIFSTCFNNVNVKMLNKRDYK